MLLDFSIFLFRIIILIKHPSYKKYIKHVPNNQKKSGGYNKMSM